MSPCTTKRVQVGTPQPGVGTAPLPQPACPTWSPPLHAGAAVLKWLPSASSGYQVLQKDELTERLARLKELQEAPFQLLSGEHTHAGGWKVRHFSGCVTQGRSRQETNRAMQEKCTVGLNAGLSALYWSTAFPSSIHY